MKAKAGDWFSLTWDITDFYDPVSLLIGNTWSNLFGILLTNSFSIIGTIMGVKYASEQKEQK